MCSGIRVLKHFGYKNFPQICKKREEILPSISLSMAKINFMRMIASGTFGKINCKMRSVSIKEKKIVPIISFFLFC